MLKSIKKYIVIMLVTMLAGTIISCEPIDKLQKKMGWKNEYFEYLNTKSVEKISIQSTRDPGFKFIVTEENAIKNMYDLLSKAEISETKSQLEPDYIFEFDLGDEKKQFHYVVGSHEGNFYNDEVIFSASNRLDEGIIQNLSVIRKPRDFDYIYYNSIIEVLRVVGEKINLNEYKIGINIKSDIECLRYVFSIDIQKFLENIRKVAPNVELVDNNEENFDLVLTLKNRGYDSINYKTRITVNNRKDKITDEYYVIGENEYKEWFIGVSEVNVMPQNW